ncbi:hypothetical protein R6Q59_035633 [Mikania micrantha]
MSFQAHNQHKGVNTKKKVGDSEPVVVAPTRPEKRIRRRSLHFQKLGSMCRKTQLLVVKKGPDFWSKVRSHFFQTMSRGAYHTNGIYSQKWQTHRSGQSDAMIESEAVDQLRQEFNTAFTLKRSWEIMTKCPNYVRIPTVQPSPSK